MPDYSKAKIYTIRYRGDDSLVYVGSTVQSLSVRMAEHRRKYNVENRQEYNMLLYIKMRETNINDWHIELYEEYPCENKEQLCKREGQVIREIGTLNKKIEGRTRQEWCIEHADKIKEHKKKWYQDNIDKIKEKKGQKYTCECGSTIRNDKKSKHIKTKKHQDYLNNLAINREDIADEH